MTAERDFMPHFIESENAIVAFNRSRLPRIVIPKFKSSKYWHKVQKSFRKPLLLFLLIFQYFAFSIFILILFLTILTLPSIHDFFIYFIKPFFNIPFLPSPL